MKKSTLPTEVRMLQERWTGRIGSGAQREVVEDTLLVALMRSGHAEKARNLLDRRLHRRPSPRDAAWRVQLAA
jgi:hypothetical protein